MPPPLALLALGGVLVAAAAGGKTRTPTPKPPPKAPPAPAGRGTIRARARGAVRYADDWPAPYRYDDALLLARRTIAAARETKAGAFLWKGETLARNLAAIEAAPLPRWRKTYAILGSVIGPSFAMNAWWHWSRPQTEIRDQQFRAIALWWAAYWAMPIAAAPAGIESAVMGSSMLEGTAPYLDPSVELRTDLSELERRRCLYDRIVWVGRWAYERGERWTSMGPRLAAMWVALSDLERDFPPSADLENQITGNWQAVAELVAQVETTRAEEVRFDFEGFKSQVVGSMIAGIAAVIVAAAAVVLAPAIAAAVAVAVGAIAALAHQIAMGSVSEADYQETASVAVDLGLREAGIDLESPPDDLL